MTFRTVNRLSGLLVVLLAMTALLVVLWGFTQPPLPDEGAGAHIFQLSIVGLLPMTLVFVTTADWTRPARSALPLIVAAPLTGLAFVALYLLEHPH